MNNVLDWSKYGLVLPVDLINKTNYNKFISQEALDVLAPYPLQGDRYEKHYKNSCSYEIKFYKTKDNYETTITVKLNNEQCVFLQTRKGEQFAKLELVFVDDYKVRDKLHIDSNNVCYTTTGQYFAFNNIEKTEEEHNAK